MPAINVQPLEQNNFGSYLLGILPDDLARAAGAFSVSMRQIKNIQSVPPNTFGQIASNIESMKNLNVNSVSGLPADLELSRDGLYITGKGDGPYQTYTMSNFFGCMSALPYASPWQIAYGKILEVQTPWLIRTYRENFLAVTWERAIGEPLYGTYSVNVQPYIENPPNPKYQPNPALPDYDPNKYINYASGVGTNDKDFQPRIDNWFYKITGVRFVLKPGKNSHLGGGGYGREGAPPPLVAFIEAYSPPSGATAVTTINTNDQAVPRTTTNGFGCLSSITLTSPGNPVLYGTTSVMRYALPPSPPLIPPRITIECPPTAIVYPPATASNTPPGTAGWPTMNATVQDYINRANKEIKDVILVNKPAQCSELNNAWNTCGLSLFYEQRARSIGLPELPPTWPNVPRDKNYSRFPAAQYSFLDLVPTYAQNTAPHMYAQTIEAISNWSSLGARSGIGLMRESRNQGRLLLAGIPLDNSIPDSLSAYEQSELLYNGSFPIGDKNATPIATLVIPDPSIYNPGDPTAPLPNDNGQLVIRPPWIPPGQAGSRPGVPRPDIPPPIGTGVGTWPPRVPGDLNKPPYVPVVPPPWRVGYIDRNLSSSSYSVDQAIEQVIYCNCDCWDGL